MEFKNKKGPRNRVRIGLSYRPARLHRLAESIPWNRFLGSLKVLKDRLCTAVKSIAPVFAKNLELESSFSEEA